jgi:protocatechuate 3,4-dioxygenase alpha subunit
MSAAPDAGDRPAMRLPTTSSQTIGPYLHIGLTWLNTPNLVANVAGVRSIVIAGRVVDGDGAPVSDANVEIWQADASGKYAHPEDTRDLPGTPGFQGFGRCATDAQGRYAFTTLKPGRVPAPGGGWQAPHVNVTILMRGMLRRLNTRIYFGDEAAANAEDAVLASVPPARRATLLAAPAADPGHYAWDVVLQGEGETVFFAI